MENNELTQAVESLTQVVEKYSTFKYRIISGLLT
jgi:hypothetical protein